MIDDTSSEAFFEAKYQCQPDPWNFTSSSYENERYGFIIQELSGRVYQRAFEPGCSIGVLTQQLAPLCGELEALEISATASARARLRCHRFPQVNITHGALPEALPGGMFDLIVLSEIGYYFDQSQLRIIVRQLVSRLLPDGVLLAAHWLCHSPDHKLSGDRVHEVIAAADGLKPSVKRRYPGFRIDKWTEQ